MAATADLKAQELYDSDEHAWIEQQVALLRSGDLDRLDRGHLIEVLTDMAKRDRRELQSRLVVLYSHVLKYLVQPEKISASWRRTILEQQRAIRAILDDHPSLAEQADEIVRKIYPDAHKQAVVETGLDAFLIPHGLRYDLQGLLDFEL
jgi:hypothetical protein